MSSQTEKSSLSALNVSIALKCFPIQVSLVKKASGVHDTSFWSNMKCDIYIRKELCANVVLSSATTMFQEIVERMTNEPTALAPFTPEAQGGCSTRVKFSVRIGVRRVYPRECVRQCVKRHEHVPRGSTI